MKENQQSESANSDVALTRTKLTVIRRDDANHPDNKTPIQDKESGKPQQKVENPKQQKSENKTQDSLTEIILDKEKEEVVVKQEGKVVDRVKEKPKQNHRSTNRIQHVDDRTKPNKYNRDQKQPSSRFEAVKALEGITLNIINKTEDKPSKPDKDKPEYTIGDKFRHLEDLLGNATQLKLYLVEPISFGPCPVINAYVRSQPISLPIPHKTFEYHVEPMHVMGRSYPAVHIHFEEINMSGRITTVRDFDIEYELITGCFNSAIGTDYNNVLTSVVPMVNRSCLDVPKTGFDLRSKAEAIAALWIYHHPNEHVSYSTIAKQLFDIRPRPAGFYAYGSTDAPKVGEHHLNVHWKRRVNLRKAWYAARCLLPQYRNFHCLFVPARTQEEYEKGFAKRLVAPPREPCTFRGYVWDLTVTNNLMKATTNWCYEHYIKDIAARVAILQPQQVIDKCTEHARMRFTDRHQVDAYTSGATVAMTAGPLSADLKECIDQLVEYNTFDKKEFYDKPKPIRFIMSPEIKIRGFMHALLMNAQKRLFGNGFIHNPHCVKNQDEPTRRDFVLNEFGSSKVCVTDYTAMESSISKYVMEYIEREMFTKLAEDPIQRSKIALAWDKLINSDYHISCKNYSLYHEPMRMSGQEHTSSGNYLANMVWMHCIVFMITGYYPDPRTFNFLCEGDDGLFPQQFKLTNGETYVVKPDDWTTAAKALGASLKIELHDNVEESKFCGIQLGPALVNGEPREELTLDTDYTIRKVVWSCDFDPGTNIHDTELAYCRALSYLLRARGNQQLYECLWYICQITQPSRRASTRGHFRAAWYKTFYKGGDEDVPDVEETWSLSKFAEKHQIPDLGVIDEPAYLRDHTTEQPLDEVWLDDSNRLAISIWWRSLFGTECTTDRYQTDIDTNDGQCLFRCVHGFLARTHQLEEDEVNYDDFYAQKTALFGEEIYDDHIADLLGNDQFIDLEYPNGHHVRMTRNNQTVVLTTPPQEQQVFIKLNEQTFGDDLHATLITLNDQEERHRRVRGQGFVDTMVGLLNHGWIFALLPIFGCILMLLFYSWYWNATIPLELPSYCTEIHLYLVVAFIAFVFRSLIGLLPNNVKKAIPLLGLGFFTSQIGQIPLIVVMTLVGAPLVLFLCASFVHWYNWSRSTGPAVIGPGQTFHGRVGLIWHQIKEDWARNGKWVLICAIAFISAAAIMLFMF